MQPLRVPVVPVPESIRPRTALVASSDRSFRQRLHEVLAGLRWKVREVGSGAEAWSEAELYTPEAVIVDSWLPDLDHDEFLSSFQNHFPEVDLLNASGIAEHKGPRCQHRQELLYALHRCQDDDDTVIWNAPSSLQVHPGGGHKHDGASFDARASEENAAPHMVKDGEPETGEKAHATTLPHLMSVRTPASSERLPELVGNAACMLEVSRRIRLVAPRSTPVLIEGPTGSGKELVAQAVHRLSLRSRKPFVAINCAAIPEALLEAELFGHTRGAFTGAVQRRIGRIESADGGTLFLDEIGEMPLALQAKLLRFVECGELQRIGDNETLKVDVRIVAATHRPLADRAQSGEFRSDLYYRLAVFLVRTPALASHLEDLPLLVEHFLEQMGKQMPKKRIDTTALAKLTAHNWPGNVRELEHVLERAAILAGDEPVLTSQNIDFGEMVN